MSEDFIVLFPPDDETIAAPFARVSPRDKWIRTHDAVTEAYRARTAIKCLAFDSVELVRTVTRIGVRRPHRLLLIEWQEPRDAAFWARLDALRAHFKEVVGPSMNVLPPDELADALAAPHHRNLAIALKHDPEAHAIYILRGSLDTLVIPQEALSRMGEGPEPDFSQLRIEDCGQTIQAGAYEAAVDALLYEFDRRFRKELKEQRRTEERTLGASIRRLRLQRGLRQSDFPGVSAKEIARIERGEVARPRPDTLEHIAAYLGVSVRELQDY